MILLFLIILVVWKTGCFDSEREDTTADGDLVSKSKEDNPSQLPLPYPQPPSENYETTKGLGPNTCKWCHHDRILWKFLTDFIFIATTTLVDPYLVTKNIDNSLISKEDSFKRTEIPEPALKRRESVNHSVIVDLPSPEPEPMVGAHQLPELKLGPTIELYEDDKKSNKRTYLIQIAFWNVT